MTISSCKMCIRDSYKDEAGALWFRSTDFGDDKDRVLIKTNGEYTYFASDVAYHWNKFQRVDHVIDIWGADHHGYIQRVKSACTALGLSLIHISRIMTW